MKKIGENSFIEWKCFDYLQSSIQMELTASTHTRCKDQYSDLDLIENYTMLKPSKATSIEVWIEIFQLATEMLRNNLYVNQVWMMTSK